MAKKRKHKKKITRQKIAGLQNLIHRKGFGRWFSLSIPLIQCMGRRDAHFLTGLDSHYRVHKEKLKPDGSFYCSFTGFQIRYGLSRTAQQSAYKNIHKLGLVRRSELKAKDNANNLILNNTACYIWSWIVYRHLEEIEVHSSCAQIQLSAEMIKQELSKLYRAVLECKSLRKQFKNFVKEMKKDYKPKYEDEEYCIPDDCNYVDKKEKLYWIEDDVLEMFYEKFLELYKEKWLKP